MTATTENLPMTTHAERKLRTTCIVLDEEDDRALEAMRRAMGRVTQSAVLRMCLRREYQRQLRSGDIAA